MPLPNPPYTGLITIGEEGVSQGFVRRIDFTGSGITASVSGAEATINASGGGSVSFTAASLVASFGLQFAIVNVVDAGITALSKVQISWGMVTQTDENTPDMDDVSFNATPAAGSMDVLISSRNQNVGGTYKVMYLVG